MRPQHLHLPAARAAAKLLLLLPPLMAQLRGEAGVRARRAAPRRGRRAARPARPRDPGARPPDGQPAPVPSRSALGAASPPGRAPEPPASTLPFSSPRPVLALDVGARAPLRSVRGPSRSALLHPKSCLELCALAPFPARGVAPRPTPRLPRPPRARPLQTHPVRSPFSPPPRPRLLPLSRLLFFAHFP